MPYSVDINFLNKSRQYSVCNQHATRSSVTTKKSITIDLPSVLNEYEAFHIAKTTLYNFWLECLQYSFALPMRYMFISPSDVITLEFCNRMHCIRVTSVEIGRNGIVKILGVSENLDIYKNDNCSIDVEDQYVDLNLGTHLEILDIPTLPQETGDYSNARVLIAACGMSNNWSGCNISYAEELDDVFQSMIDIRSAATIGATLEILGEASQYITDNQNSVAVSLLHGYLYSITLQELLNNGNLALIGDEIIQFQTAELVSENCYRLSNLLRGRFGTEHKIKNHSIGERFILLDSKVETFNMPHFTIGQSFKIKTSTLGRNANIHDDFTKHINYHAENLKPLSPVLFSKNYLDNGIEIKWIRRTRINGAWRNNVEVPLCETECKYLVNISKGNKLVMERTTKSEVLFIPYIDVGIKDRKELNDSNEHLVQIAQFSGVLGAGEQLSIRI